MSDVLKAALKDWRSCNEILHTLREDQVKEMLRLEMTGQRRAAVVERVHQRYCTLRTRRERMELLENLAGGCNAGS